MPNTNLEEELKCPLCGKPYSQHDWKITGGGNYTGDAELLGSNMIKRSKHDWNKHGSIAAHHLICAHLVNDEGEEEVWKKICEFFDYDINKKENGVWLTMNHTLACHLKMPLHFSNHGSGFGGHTYMPKTAATITYYEAVEAELNRIKNEYYKEEDPCKKEDKDGLIADMDKLSKRIFENIEKFTWTLTYDAINYHSASLVGCGNKELPISEKQKNVRELKKAMGGNKASIGGFKLTNDNVDNIRQIREKFLEELEHCGCKRIHLEHITVIQKKLRWGGTY